MYTYQSPKFQLEFYQQQVQPSQELINKYTRNLQESHRVNCETAMTNFQYQPRYSNPTYLDSRKPLVDYNCPKKNDSTFYSSRNNYQQYQQTQALQENINQSPNYRKDELQKTKERIEQLQNIINEINTESLKKIRQPSPSQKNSSQTRVTQCNISPLAYRTECPSRAHSQNRQTPESFSQISFYNKRQEDLSANHPQNMETWLNQGQAQSQLQQNPKFEKSRMLTPPIDRNEDSQPFSDLFTKYLNQLTYGAKQTSPRFNNAPLSSSPYIKPFNEEMPSKKQEDFKTQLNQFLTLHRETPEDKLQSELNQKLQSINPIIKKNDKVLTTGNYSSQKHALEYNLIPQLIKINQKLENEQNLLKTMHDSEKKPDPEYKTNTKTSNSPLPTQKQQQVKPKSSNDQQIQINDSNNILLTVLNSQMIEPNLDNYVLGKVLGLGSYAVVFFHLKQIEQVRIATQSASGIKYAIKTYEKSKLQDLQKRKNVTREIKILSKLRHPNIIKLNSAVETASQLHLVMEFTSSTSLNGYIKTKQNRKLNEDEVLNPSHHFKAKIIFKQIVDAVKYCHHKNVVHRDIKLENLLVNENRVVKLIDFGFSIAIDPATKLNVFCGTPSYMAPEIVNKMQYSFPADIWALGILLFKILTSAFPFRGSDDKELYRKINSGKIEFPSSISAQARFLIQKMLRVNQSERPSAKEVIHIHYPLLQILKDEWFNFSE